MEMNLQIPFQQLLKLVRDLSPSQKAKLRQELSKKSPIKSQDNFIDYLLKGPVYKEDDLQIIEENRKSISEWRTNG